MIYTRLTKRAMALCYKIHQHQQDEYGMPFVMHPLAVAEQMQDETSTCVALLHDSISKGGLSSEDLLDEGFPKDIVVAVEALSQAQGEDDEDYLYRVKQNHVARAVKVAELIHETDMGRLNEVTQKDIDRIKHYRQALLSFSAEVEEKGYFVCTVVFSKMPKKLYYYRADDTTIKADDEVVVPVGDQGKTSAGKVLTAGFYTYPTLPIPLSRMKYVIRKFDRDAMQLCPISGRLIDKMTCYHLSSDLHGKNNIKTHCLDCEHYHK